MKRNLAALTDRKAKKTEQEQAAVQRPKKPAGPKKKLKSFYLTPDAITQINVLAAENGTSGTALAAEAFNALFAKYGKDEVA